MKYAKREFERCFLLRTEPEPLPARCKHILDAYIVGTTLRLRQVVDSEGAASVYKLTQKKRDDDGQIWVTNIYLSENEAALFRSLPAEVLKKRRYHLAQGAISQGIDIIEAVDERIVLLEIEGECMADIQTIPSGFDIVREVTHEADYTGYAIARRLSRGMGTRDHPK